MLAALIIVFREVIEAGLVIGIVLAAARGVPGRGVWVGLGVLAGVVMARHGRAIAAEVKAVGDAVASGIRPMTALAIVVGMAVLREGSEVVLFLYGIAVSGSQSFAAMAAGGALGVLLGGALTALMYFGLLRIPARYLFSATSGLFALLASGMAAQAVGFLEIAGVATVLPRPVWDASDLLSDSSVLGKVLNTLIGYNDHPTMLQVLVYVATLASILMMMRLFGTATRKQALA